MEVRIILVCKRIRSHPEKSMHICICYAVTEREIRGAIALGSSSVAELGESLGVGTCCGRCVPDVRKILKSCAKECERAGPHLRLAAGD
jgi:bacterioferritin-associated ferredoxin